jgi:hypothetical protein
MPTADIAAPTKQRPWGVVMNYNTRIGVLDVEHHLSSPMEILDLISNGPDPSSLVSIILRRLDSDEEIATVEDGPHRS